MEHLLPPQVVPMIRLFEYGRPNLVITSIALESCQTIYGGSREHLDYVWDATEKKLIRKSNAHTYGVSNLASKLVGNALASAGGNLRTGERDTTVLVCDASRGN